MPPTPAKRDTREALLDAAERLFAQRGLAGASVRDITRRAGANVAAVHYHFGSKEGLVRAVLARRVGPLNQERLRLLAECESRASRGAPELSCILRAFAAPAVRMIRDRGGQHIARLLAWTFSEPDEKVQELVLQEFQEVVDRFTRALARALPDLSRRELVWRFHFMVGATAWTAGFGSLARRYSRGLCDPADVEEVIPLLTAFLAGGWRKAPVERQEKKP